MLKIDVIAWALCLDKCRIAYHHGNKTEFVQSENCVVLSNKSVNPQHRFSGDVFLSSFAAIIEKETQK